MPNRLEYDWFSGTISDNVSLGPMFTSIRHLASLPSFPSANQPCGLDEHPVFMTGQRLSPVRKE